MWGSRSKSVRKLVLMAMNRMNIHQLASVVAIATVVVSCATHKLCSEAGDTSWPNSVRGDKVCYQKELPDGRIVNQGAFVQYFPSGKKFLEGSFKDGEKDGYWTQYNESGKKVVEKYYDNGLEKSPPVAQPETDQGRPRGKWGSAK